MRQNDQVVQTLVLGFSPISDVLPVRDCLNDWGYHVTRVAGGDSSTFDKPGDHPDFLTVVFGSHRPDNQRLKLALKPFRGLPCLGVFAGGFLEDDRLLMERCHELVCWPCDYSEFTLRALRALERESHQQPVLASDCPSLLGQSIVFKKVLQQIELFRDCSAPVLIEGETGTGKEMVARAIHYRSKRAKGPFIPVNCGALPDSLVENELFGHARGAYTDARTEQAGLIAQAAGGTLFLDEIEALSHKAQVALLRFLQEQTFRPLGSERSVQADVRVIAASNENLNGLVEAGRLRQDLFFRLNILYISLPPLRERVEDIPLLVQHFIAGYCEQYKLEPKTLSDEGMHHLCMQPWPGNIRELENSIHRIVLLSQNDKIGLKEFEIGMSRVAIDETSLNYDFPALCFSQAKSKVIDSFEKHYLQKLMCEVHGNITLAARRARKERRALGKLLKKHGINRDDYIHD